MDALNLKSDVSDCTLWCRLLKNLCSLKRGFTSSFCPNSWNDYAFVVFVSIYFMIVPCEIILECFGALTFKRLKIPTEHSLFRI